MTLKRLCFVQQEGVISDNHQAACRDHVGKAATALPDLTTSLIISVKKLISRGRLRPGEKLPTERHLAADFGVNRASLRQALKALVAMGVLTQRVGDGTYLSPKAHAASSLGIKPPRLMDGVTIAELLDARSIVEPVLVARAAMNRTEADIVALESAVAAIDKSIDLGLMSLALKDELAFYKRLWEAAGERIVCKILNPIHLAISQSIEASLPLFRYKRMVRGHREILEAVRSGNPEAASKAMEKLLKITCKELSERLLFTAEASGRHSNSFVDSPHDG